MKKILFRRPVFSWALYDWANSAFATTVMAGFFPVFFKQYWNVGVGVSLSTSRLAFINSAASLAVAALAPLLGAVADRGGARIRYMTLFTVLGAAMTAALYWVGKGHWQLAAIFYALASIGFWGGVTFNDSLLIDVAEESQYDRVSSYGYSLGYLGGGLLFLVNVLMTLHPSWFGLADAAQAVRVSFVIVGVWWAVFTIPLLLFVREKVPAVPLKFAAAAAAGWHELARTLVHLRLYKNVVLFLAAYWLYIDGVNTIIKMAVDYGLSLGFPSSSLITALLLTQFVAFPAALAFGWIGGRYGSRKGILIGIGVYFVTTLWAYSLSSVTEFYMMAVVIGLVQGGVQGLSRSLFGRLIPPEKSGEFFGFFNMMGKFAAVLGPALIGWVNLVTSSSRLAIASIAVLFAAGGALLCFVREDRDAA